MELPSIRFDEVLHQLPDTPGNVQLRHFLRTRLCKVFATAAVDVSQALIIQADAAAAEPNALGFDAVALYGLLTEVECCDCVLIADSVAPELAATMQAHGLATKFYGDVELVLDQPAARVEHPDVRLLTPDDVSLLEAAPPELRGAGWGSAGALLRHGKVAAALLEQCIVSIAHTYAVTDHFADLSVYTVEAYRGQGLSTAAVSLVCQALQANLLTPVWSCGETNAASLRVAGKIGFTRHATRTYVIKA